MVTSAQLAAYNDLGNGNGILYFTNDVGGLDFLQGKGLGIQNDSFGANYASELFNNTAFGLTSTPVRVYLDVAATDVEVVSGEEITAFLSTNGFGAAASVQNVVVTANAVTVVRDSSIMLVRIDGVTTMGNANRVTTLTVTGAVAGDRITLSGKAASVPPVLTTGAFAYLEYEITLTGEQTTVTFLRTVAGTWVQVVPNKMNAVALRNQGVATPIQPGVYQITPAAGTFSFLDGSTGVSAPANIYESSAVLVGAGVVLGADMFIDVIADPLAPGSDPKEGDTISVSGNLIPITVAGNAVNFGSNGSVVATLPEDLALSGAWFAQGTYVGNISGVETVFWSITPVFSTTNTQFIVTDMIKDANVTNAKLATGIDGGKLTARTVIETALSTSVQAKLNAQGRNIVTLSVPSAEVLTLFTVPILVAPAPGVGYALLVQQVLARINYAGVIYATNLNLQLVFSGAGEAVAESSSFLIRTANGIVNIPLVYTVGAAVSQILENTDLYLRVEVGDPTLGTSDIFVTIVYSIVAV